MIPETINIDMRDTGPSRWSVLILIALYCSYTVVILIVIAGMNRMAFKSEHYILALQTHRV